MSRLQAWQAIAESLQSIHIVTAGELRIQVDHANGKHTVHCLQWHDF